MEASQELDAASSISNFLSIPKDQISKLDTDVIDALSKKSEEYNSLKESSLGLSSSISELSKTLQKEKLASQETKNELLKLLEERINQIDTLKADLNKVVEENKNLYENSHKLTKEIETSKDEKLLLRTQLDKVTFTLSLTMKQKQHTESEYLSKEKHFESYKDRKELEYQNVMENLTAIDNELRMTNGKNAELFKRNEELSKDLRGKISEIKSLENSLKTSNGDFLSEKQLQDQLINALQNQIKTLQEQLESLSDEKFDDPGTQKLDKHELLRQIKNLNEKLEISERERLSLVHSMEEFQNIPEEESSSVSSHASGRNNSALSLSGDVNILRKHFLKERQQKRQLEEQMRQILQELERNMPSLSSYKERSTFLEKELNSSNILLEHIKKENLDKSAELEKKESECSNLRSSINSLAFQRTVLARQVKYLLLIIQNNETLGSSLGRKDLELLGQYLAANTAEAMSDSEKILLERLAQFKNVKELQNRNMQLLQVSRELASKAEKLEKVNLKQISSEEDETINDAKEAILVLQEYSQKLESQIKELSDELAVQKKEKTEKESISAMSKIEDDASSHTIDLGKQLSANLKHSKDIIDALNSEIENLHQANTDVNISLDKEKSARKLAEDRYNLLEYNVSLLKSEKEELQEEVNKLQQNILDKEKQFSYSSRDYISCKSKLSTAEAEITSLRAENELSIETQTTLRTKKEALLNERNNLRMTVTQMNSLNNELQTLLKETKSGYDDKLKISALKCTQTNNQLQLVQQRMSELKSQNDSEIKWYKATIDDLKANVFELNEELKQKEEKIEEFSKTLENVQNELTLANSKDVSEEKRALEKELSEVKSQLEKSNLEVKEYENVISTSKRSFENKSIQYEDRIKALASKLDSELRERTTLQENLSTLQARMVVQQDELTSNNNTLSELRVSYDSLLLEQKTFKDKEAELRSVIAVKTGNYDSLSKSYERIMQENSELSKVVELLREEVKNRTSNGEKEGDLEDTESIIKKGQDVWDEEKKVFEVQITNLNERLSELLEENESLLARLESQDKGNNSPSAETNAAGNEETLAALRSERTSLIEKLTAAQKEERSVRHKLRETEHALSENAFELKKIKSQIFELSSLPQNEHDILRHLVHLKEQREEKNKDALGTNKYMEQPNKVTTEAQEKIQDLEEQLNGAKNLETTSLEHDSLVQEMKDNFEKEKSSLLSQQEQEIEKLTDNERKLREFYEEEIQKKVSQAEENLKKRIRLPTEEKINGIIEKRKSELESSFEQKIKEEAKSLLLHSDDDKIKKIYKEIEESGRETLQQEFDEQLNIVRKKAFEEGKQHVLMKSAFLERKISMLEGQLKEKNKLNNNSKNLKENVSSTDEHNSSIQGNPFFNLGKEQMNVPRFTSESSTMSTTSSLNPFTSFEQAETKTHEEHLPPHIATMVDTDDQDDQKRPFDEASSEKTPESKKTKF
ncbi:hypothetical protein KAFR_0H00210 [Kazachstania africana CBS 2517]|uniref:NUA/TPR/MLP1-2-like domain-containing protein n=1 Tax=Kazachstania africana (strain ATCC 22294 / BCRC 22015 / CBS 2517 / CECT 1963 / NBRC 1671 / NRRL Y-8276) TaxID=1071382 RepID=H2AYM4_KAZAF|nr:hypothetical protein KAFR_0H00210 [Kazachstania africana CBS 2517]CCF59430.1 hypothetical protein KAFR_0H00210 [Kazachstania africana CBS 2517]